MDSCLRRNDSKLFLLYLHPRFAVSDTTQVDSPLEGRLTLQDIETTQHEKEEYSDRHIREK